MVSLITDKVNNNDGGWFKKFTKTRKKMEQFLVDNKSLIGIILQNMSRLQRVPKMRDLFAFLVDEIDAGRGLTPESAIGHLGLRGRIIDVTGAPVTTYFSDETKSAAFIEQALKQALKCGVCGGLLHPSKSISYDHKMRVAEGGDGRLENAQLLHPFCNSGVKG
jgi:hypothetical protein